MCVFVGTTNESEFLTDPTGARRFWPVRVTGLDREALRQDRDQLWAEALVAHEDGERWWPEGQNEVAALANAAEARQQRDPWEDVLIPWLAARAATGDELTMATALEACGVEKGRMTAKEAARAASILRRAGWERRHTRDGKRWTVGERAQRLLTLA
jgi:predicted P-loop ATPase